LHIASRFFRQRRCGRIGDCSSTTSLPALGIGRERPPGAFALPAQLPAIPRRLLPFSMTRSREGVVQWLSQLHTRCRRVGEQIPAASSGCVAEYAVSAVGLGRGALQWMIWTRRRRGDLGEPATPLIPGFGDEGSTVGDLVTLPTISFRRTDR